MKFFSKKEKEDNKQVQVKSKIITLSKLKETGLQRKVLVYIAKREADGLHVIKKIKAKEPITEVNWQARTYLLKPDGVSYFEKGIPVYIFDYENSLPLSFSVDKESLKSDYVFQLFNKQILRQLISSIGKTQKIDLITLVIGVIMGISMGIVIGMYLAPHIFSASAVSTSSSTSTSTAPNPFSK